MTEGRTNADMLYPRLMIAALIATAPALAWGATKPVPAKTPATKSVAKPATKPTTSKPKATASKPKPKTPLIAISPLSHDEKDGFGVLQVAVPDTADFIAGWKLGGGGKSATMRTVANKPLFTILIFHGCKADAEGKCDIVADFVITRPDGTTNDENKGIVVWNKAAPTDPKKPYLGDGALGYGVDDEGPFGDYRVVATVTDRVAGTTLTTEQTLTIVSGKTAAPTKPAVAPATTDVPAPPAKPDEIKPADPAPAAPTAEPAEPPAK